jgi:hypothetical protein
MFTLVAYEADVAAGYAALTAIAPVPDPHVTIDGKSVIVPKELNKLIGVSATFVVDTVAAGLGKLVQLQSPGLRRVFNQDITHMSDGLDVINAKHPQMQPSSPVPLDPDEGLQAWESCAALVNNNCQIGVWLADGPIAKAEGEIRTIRFTSTTPSAQGEWTLGALSVVQELPQGDYAVVGARVVSALDTGLFRLIFTGYDWRPGGILSRGVLENDMDIFRRGNLGIWGTFNWRQLPRIEVCSVLASPVADPTVYLDLIKIA